MKIFSRKNSSTETLTVYHGDNFGSIKLEPRAMYLPNARCEEGPGIYFTTNRGTAQIYGRDILIAEIDPSRFLPSRAIASTVLDPSEIRAVLSAMGVRGSGAEIAELMSLEVRELLITLIKMAGSNIERFISAWASATDYDGTIYTVPCTETARTVPGERFIAILNPDIKVVKDFSNVKMRGDDLRGLDLSGVDFSGSELTDVNLAGANLTGANLTRTSFVGVNAEGTNFAGVRGYFGFENCNCDRATFEGAQISSFEAVNSSFRNADFRDSVTDEGLNFGDCDMSGADFTGAVFPYFGYSGDTRLPAFSYEQRKNVYPED